MAGLNRSMLYTVHTKLPHHSLYTSVKLGTSKECRLELTDMIRAENADLRALVSTGELPPVMLNQGTYRRRPLLQLQARRIRVSHAHHRDQRGRLTYVPPNLHRIRQARDPSAQLARGPSAFRL